MISSITSINLDLLRNRRSLEDFSCAQKLSWAAFRQTTRPEDRAYSLLGLFGITLPLLYGEGHAAFRRLQEEIMKRGTDQSLFAWKANGAVDFLKEQSWENFQPCCILAPSPDYFRGSSSIVPIPPQEWERFWKYHKAQMCLPFTSGGCFEEPSELTTGNEPYGMTNTGLQITFPAATIYSTPRVRLIEAALFCYDEKLPQRNVTTICLVQKCSGKETRRAEPHYLGKVAKPGLHRLGHWATEVFIIQSIWITPEFANRHPFKHPFKVRGEVSRCENEAMDKISAARTQGEANFPSKAHPQKRNREEERKQLISNNYCYFCCCGNSFPAGIFLTNLLLPISSL
jgi:hypothetical protein